MRPPKTTERFIQDAIAVHGDKYDYSETIYINSQKKIKVICPDHGAFYQIATDHLHSGCPKCNAEKQKRIRKSQKLKKVIEESLDLYGEQYDYSHAYLDEHDVLILNCPKHGEFKTSLQTHLKNKGGCPKCRIDSYREKEKLNFLKKANLVHHEKYSYSHVNYKNTHTAIAITCPIHGDFFQTPTSHLTGAGCPICRLTRRWIPVKSEEIKKY